VYTADGTNYSEVIVDHETGEVAQSKAITSGDDLTAAKAQAEAMSTAKISLQAAVGKAEKVNKGYRAMSVVPSVKDGHTTADVTLIKGADSKTENEKLD
jgi:hypothetical protein